MEKNDLKKTVNYSEITYSGSTMPNWQMTRTGDTIPNYTQCSSKELDIDELITMKLAHSTEQPHENLKEYIRTQGILYNRYYVSD